MTSSDDAPTFSDSHSSRPARSSGTEDTHEAGRAASSWPTRAASGGEASGREASSTVLARVLRLALQSTEAAAAGIAEDCGARDRDDWRWIDTHGCGAHGEHPPGDLSVDPAVLDALPQVVAETAGGGSVAGVPLPAPDRATPGGADISQETPSRVLVVTARCPHAFTDRTLRALTDLAALAAQADADGLPATKTGASGDPADEVARYRSFLDRVPVGVYRTTPCGRVVYANPALVDMLGHASFEDLAEVDLEREGFAADDREAFKQLVEENGAIRQRETEWQRADDRPIRVLESACAVRDDDGTVLYYEGIVEDITDRAAYEAALREAKEEAEKMNRLKTAFLANVSHEIRTPLTSIIGFADVLAEEVDEDARELLSYIRRSGQRLQDTLTSVLELARLESESLDLRVQRVDVTDAVRDAADLMRPQVIGTDLSLRLDLPDRVLYAECDPKALHRIVTNLLSNAVKFTPEGRVTVRVRAAGESGTGEPETEGLETGAFRREEMSAGGEHVQIDVIDTGVGIGQDFLAQIFDEFQQEAGEAYRTGSGLGLAITRRLVTLCGGTIRAASTKGSGSTFTVRLPRA